MPKFILNAPRRYMAESERRRTERAKRPSFYDLNEFARGYVEACFFTNGDDDSDADENSLNELGVERLTHAAVRVIRDYCADFETLNSATLATAYATDGYDATRAGNDLWYSSKGHGTGYWDRGLGETGIFLDRAAKGREIYVESSRGWIHAR